MTRRERMERLRTYATAALTGLLARDNRSPEAAPAEAWTIAGLMVEHDEQIEQAIKETQYE